MIQSPIERAKSLIASQQDTTRPDIFELNATLIAQFIIVPIRQEYDKALREAIFKELWRRYGTGRYMLSLHVDSLKKAINEAEVEE